MNEKKAKFKVGQKVIYDDGKVGVIKEVILTETIQKGLEYFVYNVKLVGQIVKEESLLCIPNADRFEIKWKEEKE